MMTNSRSLALIFALTASTGLAISLSIMGYSQGTGFWIIILAVLGLFYGIFHMILRKLVFNKLERIAHSVQIKNGQIKNTITDPIVELQKEIKLYQAVKERKIEELEKRAAFRREFIADISHELKTPLFAAQGFVHTLLDGAVKDKAVREKFLKKAAKSLDGLDMLVQDLLSLSQIETGDITAHYEYFDLRELTEEVFEQFESRSQKKDIQLSISVDEVNSISDQQIFVHADSRLIYQVISNLVSNAVKYSKTEGTVEVAIKEGKEQVEIIVVDQGIGIPKKHQPRIFERFYRVEKSRSKIKDKGGTGLGLAIVKHILEAHDSKITVQSKSGEGSVFSFKLRKDPPRSPVY